MIVETDAHTNKTMSKNPPKKVLNFRCCLYFCNENLYSHFRPGYLKEERTRECFPCDLGNKLNSLSEMGCHMN